MKLISIRCDTLSLLHVCLLSSYHVYNCVYNTCAFTQTIGWSGIRTHGMLCIPQFSRLIPLTAQTSILCTTMHVCIRPDKGISIIWCVPYVCLCIAPNAQHKVCICVCTHVCTISLWYEYHLKLYGA